MVVTGTATPFASASTQTAKSWEDRKKKEHPQTRAKKERDAEKVLVFEEINAVRQESKAVSISRLMWKHVDHLPGTGADRNRVEYAVRQYNAWGGK